jgi:uncharacterized membrane protein
MAELLRRRRRRFVQSLLISSVAAAAALMSSGLIIWLIDGRRAAPPVTPDQLVSEIHLGDRLMMAGIMLLAITPVLTVVSLFALWLRERAWRFAAASALVLSLLALALWLGGR